MLGVVIQIDAREAGTGVAVPLRAASHDHPDVCHLTDDVAWPVIAKLPKLGYDLFDGAFEGRIATPSASMSIGIEPWPQFAKLAIADTRFRLWTGEVGAPFAAWTQRVDARVTQQPVVTDGRAELTFAVDDRWLDRALLDTYDGTTGAEGPAALKGQAKPLALGAPRYVPGVLVDPATSLFQISGYGPIVAVDAALERLLRYGAPVQDYPDVSALLAAAIPAGRWATAVSGGWVRFGAPPVGQVSFLVRGDAGGIDDWSRLPGQQIRRLALLSGGGGRIADASLNALDAARPYNLSLYLDQQTTARELIQEVAASVNAVAGVSWMGRLFVQPVELGVPTVKLAADGSALPPVAKVRQLEISPPFGKVAITAERTWSVHALGDIAFAATLVDMGAYDAGTTYREGNIVLQDGSSWVYINPVPSAGNAPPQLPALSNAYWRVLAKAGVAGQDAEVLTVSASGNGVRIPAGYQHGLRKPDASPFVDPDNGNDSGTSARSYTVCFRRGRGNWKVRHFDIFGNGEVVYPSDAYAGGDRNGIQGMVNLLNDIPAGTVVVVYSSDEPNQNHGTAALVTAMVACGASRQLFGASMGYRGAYAFVGVKGWPEGKGFEARSQVTDSFVDAVVQIPFAIVGNVPTASLPAENVGAVTLVGLTGSTVVGPDFVQSAGPEYNGGWGAQGAYSKETYTGGAVAEWTLPPVHGDNMMAGLSQGDGTEGGASFGNLTFALYRASDGQTAAYINGGHQVLGPIATGETRCRVQFDGRFVRWYVNGAQIFAYDWMGTIYDPYAAANSLRFKVALASDRPRIYDVKLTPAGKSGVDGLPGDDGTDGTTWYPYFAYANSPDGQVDFTTGQPGSRAYIGTASGTSPTEPTLPGLYSWSEYKGPPFGMATRGAAVVAGRQIVKNGGGDAWDSDAFSTVGYKDGAAATFRAGQTWGAVMAGLNTDPTADASYGTLDFAWYMRGDGNASIYESGSPAPGGQGEYVYVPGYGDGTFQVAYDGQTVRYLYNGQVYREVAVGPGKTFFFDSSIHNANARLIDIDFASAGAKGERGDKGADGINPAVVTASAAPSSVRFNAVGNIISGDVTFTAVPVNAIGPVSWASERGHQIYGLPAITFNGNTMTISAGRMADVLNYNEANFGVASETIIASVAGASFKVTVTKVRDGTNGTNGSNGSNGENGAPGADGFAIAAIAPFLIPVFPDGSGKTAWKGGTGVIRLYKGKSEITAGVAYSIEGATSMIGLNLNGQTFNFASISGDAGYFTIVATFEGVSYRSRVDVKKAYDGSAAFRANAQIPQLRGADFSGSGQTAVPGGSTVRVYGSLSYSAPDPNGDYTEFTGRMFLYYRNISANGPLTALGSADGSTAFTQNNGTPSEPNYEMVDGYVSAAFNFAAPATDSIIEFSARVVPTFSNGAVVLGSGGVGLSTVG